MADAGDGSLPVARLLAEYSPVLPALAGGRYTVGRVEPLDSGQRNPVARVVLRSDARDLACVAKFYLPAIDRFYDHHFRREEKILNLLNRFFPRRAPEVYGGLLVEGRAGLLLMEDAGREALDVHLGRAEGAAHRDLVAAGVRFLGEFHTMAREHFQPFYRTIQSIDLDRLNAPTFMRRLDVALGRVWHLRSRPAGTATLPAAAELAALARAAVPAGFRAAYRRQVVRPLLAAPRGTVHNSFSPQHLIMRAPDPPMLIDFETVALGAAQIDLAELLEAPAVRLAAPERLEFVARYHATMVAAGAREDTRSEFERVYHCAAIARSLDYAGTTALRHLQFSARGDETAAAEALARKDVYLARARESLVAIGAAEMARAVASLGS